MSRLLMTGLGVTWQTLVIERSLRHELELDDLLALVLRLRERCGLPHDSWARELCNRALAN